MKSLENNLGIRVRREGVAKAYEFFSHLTIIIDLTIIDYLQIIIGHGLMTIGRQIENSQTSMPQTNVVIRSFEEGVSTIVRPPMLQDICHPFENLSV
jgi:hypothetical protein